MARALSWVIGALRGGRENANSPFGVIKVKKTHTSTYNLREGSGYFERLHLLLPISGRVRPLAGLLAAIGRRGGGGRNRLQSRQSYRRGGTHGIILFLVARGRRVHAGAGRAAADVHLGRKRKKNNIRLLVELLLSFGRR